MAELILPDRKLEMPSLYYPGRKPVGNVKIDRTNKITKGLTSFLFFNDFYRDIVGNQITAVGGNFTSDRSYNALNKTDRLDTNIAVTPSMTVIADFTWSNASSDSSNAIFGTIANNIVSGFELVVEKATGKVWWASIALYNVNYTTAIISHNERHIFTFAYDEFYGLSVYMDGVIIASDVNTGALNSVTTSPLQFFQRGDMYASNFDATGTLHSAMTFDRKLSESEVKSLYKNSYQILTKA